VDVVCILLEGTPVLFLRELLFMIPINLRHHAEHYSESLFEQAGYTSPVWQSLAKWPGTFGIFFISGCVTNLPDSLNSNLKSVKSEIHHLRPFIKHEVKRLGGVGPFLIRYNAGWALRGLTIAISASSTFVCMDFYKMLYYKTSSSVTQSPSRGSFA